MSLRKSRGRENLLTIRTIFMKKKSVLKWTHSVQTLVQGSTILKGAWRVGTNMQKQIHLGWWE